MEKTVGYAETASGEGCAPGPQALDLIRAVIRDWRAGNTIPGDAMGAVGTILGSLSGGADPSDFS